MQNKIISGLACLLAANSLTAYLYGAEHEVIDLVDGSRLQAAVLHSDAQRVVIDLAGEVVALKQANIVSRRQKISAVETAETSQADVYQQGRLTPAPVTELVERHGDSVVMVSTPMGLGSGFFISSQGYLITNYHVIEQQTHLRVTRFVKQANGYRKQEFTDVKIVAIHPLRDIALLQVLDEDFDPAEVAPVTLAADNSVRSGDGVFAIGNPLGLERSVTQGIVSSTTRTMGHLRFIQTDAPINPGNSGGPMFNMRGEVVGIASAGATFFDGLAFGIPVRDLVTFLDHRDAYLYDPSQPQNGVRYQMPPAPADRSQAETTP